MSAQHLRTLSPTSSRDSINPSSTSLASKHWVQVYIWLCLAVLSINLSVLFTGLYLLSLVTRACPSHSEVMPSHTRWMKKKRKKERKKKGIRDVIHAGLKSNYCVIITNVSCPKITKDWSRAINSITNGLAYCRHYIERNIAFQHRSKFDFYV